MKIYWIAGEPDAGGSGAEALQARQPSIEQRGWGGPHQAQALP